VTIFACSLNLYGFICGMALMSGRKLNYYLTLKAPLMFSWFFYMGAIGSWTIFNLLSMPNVGFGYWVYVGTGGASLLLRYHFKMYLNELKKIRTFILLMSDN
jgi:hypothetical protein